MAVVMSNGEEGWKDMETYRVPPQKPVQRTIVYYHCSRTHLALDKDAPELRERESPDGGKVIALPMVGGLHHRYTRRAG
jgi:hypothetical protein